MTLFDGVSASVLRRLSAALRDGRLAVPLSAFALERHVSPLPAALQQTVLRLSGEGMSGPHLGLLLEQAAETAEARLGAEREIEFVWTGIEGAFAQARDTVVVLEQLFAGAERSVLVSTFVVHQIATVFAPLASRMADRPALQVRVFLHVGRGLHDTRLDSEILRQCADTLRAQWPGGRLPEVYYDPRGLATDSAARATWHAKCVVVDDARAFVTSANFTEWAQARNVEAGVLVHNSAFARQVRQQFDALVASSQVRRLPGLATS